MRATPSSVAFSTSQSMRSLAGMPSASVTSRDSSRATATGSPMRTTTSLRPIASTVAGQSLPPPSNSSSRRRAAPAAPGRGAPAPGGSDSSAPAASGSATNRRIVMRRAAASTASAAAASAASCPPGAVSIRPTGSSPAAWQGSVKAQPSRKLATKVLRSSRPLARKKASSLATRSAIGGAVIGTVGQTMASKPSSRRPTRAIQSRRRCCITM